MTREEWESVLFAAVPDEVVQDQLNDYVLSLEWEVAKLREELADAPKCETCEAMLDCYECLRADDSQKERRRLDYENAKLRELVRDMWHEGAFEPGACYAEEADRLEERTRELGIEVE